MNEFKLPVSKGFDESLPTPTIVTSWTARYVKNTQLLGGIGVRNKRDLCGAFHIGTHGSIYDAYTDVWIADGNTDNSCPSLAESGVPYFAAKFNNTHRDITSSRGKPSSPGRIQAMWGIAGKELLFTFDTVITQLASRGSFVGFNGMQL